MKIAQAGSANAMQVVADVTAVQLIQPIVDVQQAQIQQQQFQIEALTESLTKAINTLTKNGGKKSVKWLFKPQYLLCETGRNT